MYLFTNDPTGSIGSTPLEPKEPFFFLDIHWCRAEGATNYVTKSVLEYCSFAVHTSLKSPKIALKEVLHWVVLKIVRFKTSFDRIERRGHLATEMKSVSQMIVSLKTYLISHRQKSETCCPLLQQNIFLTTSFKCSKMAQMAGSDEQPLTPLLHFLIPWCTLITRPNPT